MQFDSSLCTDPPVRTPVEPESKDKKERDGKVKKPVTDQDSRPEKRARTLSDDNLRKPQSKILNTESEDELWYPDGTCVDVGPRGGSASGTGRNLVSRKQASQSSLLYLLVVAVSCPWGPRRKIKSEVYNSQRTMKQFVAPWTQAGNQGGKHKMMLE